MALDSLDRFLKLRTSFPSSRKTKYPMFTDHEELLNRVLEGENGKTVTLPSSRVWDIMPTLAPRYSRAGNSWRDTINLRATLGAFAQTLEGVRTSTIEGDTIVEGRRYVLVRDSAIVRYVERSESQERTLDTFVVIRRRAQGTIVGRYLLDAALGVFHVRDDTTRLSGEAALRLPDGREFKTPARFERFRHFAHFTSEAYDSAVAQRNSHEEEFSIVRRPEGVAERIARGESDVVDSLLAILPASHDPDERQNVVNLLRQWSRKSSVRDSIQAQAFAVGDSALALAEANARWRRHRVRMDTASMRQLLRVLSDPGYAFSHGIDPDVFYENANDELLRRPPAAMSDTSDWPCTPAACRMLAAQWPRASEPRLRALALVARFSLDPASVRDTLFMASEHAPLLAGARTLAIATSAQSSRGLSGALPPPGATWRAWLAWRRRTQSWLYTQRVSAGDSRLRTDSLPLLRMAERLNDRYLEEEWRASFARQRSDSGRRVIGSLLSILGIIAESDSVIADHLRGPSQARYELAEIEMITMFASRTHPADSLLAEEAAGRLLAASLDGGESWPLLRASSARDSMSLKPHRIVKALDGAYGRQEKPVGGPVILLRPGAPPGVLAAMQRRGIRVVDSGFVLPANESALVIAMDAPQAVGPFLMISLSHWHDQARIDGRGQSWAGGATYYLLRTENGWKIVMASTWIT